jgi:5-methyltetrahydropteroyltriglutamate--homocysteine methyltransferase
VPIQIIPTTHVGSLPRGEELVPLLLARDHGKAYDTAEFDLKVQTAVDDAVARQIAAGVSVISDGELGKVGYSTYVTERLSGFGGNVTRKPALDLAPLPQLRKKLAAIMGEQEFVRASCVAPVKLLNLEPCRDDIRRFQKAMLGRSVKGFMNAASPGLITAFQPNAYYPNHETYLRDLVEAMRPEYAAIAASGFQLQLDCPDLAMSRHTGFQDASEAEFLKIAEANVEALNAATSGVAPQQMRMHVCWGNYEGPHEHEWKVWAATRIPEDKILAPGLIDTCSNYVEHPELIAQRIERFANIVGKERIMASTDCGFGTFAGYGKIDPAVTWKKLRSLREGADIAAARLG